jgi:SAM-dependent methyltransferase
VSRGFIDPDQVAAFWDGVRRGAGEDQQTGYLQDEWPPAIGQHRFNGEWRQVSAWLDQLEIESGSCLDVGCGIGLWLEHLAARFERADGIDLSAEMVASAAARLERRGLRNARVERRSVTDLVGERSYDLVFVGGVLMYLNDEEVEPMVARLARLLTARGVLILRESTWPNRTWYRDKPLGPGLFADPQAPRPPYYAIYRTPSSYREMAERQGLEVVRCQRNRHYKIADLTEVWLRVLNKLSRGRLARRPASAERAARTLHRLRHVTLLPHHLAQRAIRRRSNLDNWWYVCRRRTSAQLLTP